MKKYIISIIALFILFGFIAYSQDARVILEQGIKNFEKGRMSKAMEEFSKVIETDSTNSIAYFYRGLICKKQKKWDNAIYDFSKTIELDPNYPKVYFHRGDSYIERGMSRFIDLENASISELKEIGNKSMNRSNQLLEYQNAILDFSKEIAKNSWDTASIELRASCYLELEKYSEAYTDLSKLTVIYPSNINYHGWLAWVCYLWSKDCSTIEAENYSIIYYNRDEVGTYHTLARCYFRNKNFDQALNTIKSVQETTHQYPPDNFYGLKSYILLEQGEYQQAEWTNDVELGFAYEKAYPIMTQEILLRTSVIYYLLNKVGKSKNYFKKAMSYKNYGCVQSFSDIENPKLREFTKASKTNGLYESNKMKETLKKMFEEFNSK